MLVTLHLKNSQRIPKEFQSHLVTLVEIILKKFLEQTALAIDENFSGGHNHLKIFDDF